MDATVEKLADFTINLQFSDLPDEVVKAAKARIVSTFAVCLAAFDFDPIRILNKVVQPFADGPTASIFGTLIKTTPEMAAFVNSAMVRCLDMSDTYVSAAVTHPADAFPSIVAVCEAEGLTGRDLLLATAIIYEIQTRFVDTVPYGKRGWDQTPVVALAAALGCCRLLKLNQEQVRHAISLAIIPNIALNQTRTGMLSMWKGMAGPQGARAGVFAAYLARAGITGPDDVFEGKFGFWNQLMDGKTYDILIPNHFEGHVFGLRQTMIKEFPTRYNCQVPVMTAQKLRAQVDVNAIETLKIESIRQAFERWMDVPEIWKPETRETADHSLPCTVAMTLLDGTITPKMMRAERYKDPDVRHLISKCSIELPEEFADGTFRVRSCRLTAKLKNGETAVVEYSRSLDDDMADPGWDQAVTKFTNLTENLLDADASTDLLAVIDKLEIQESVEHLIQLTQIYI